MNARPADTVLQESYLETRAKLLEVAAVLDRIDRAATDGGESLPADSDQARQKLISGIQILLESHPERARKIQRLFSRPYEPDWRSQFGLEDEPSPTKGEPK